ncbi:MAG: phosphatidylserine decarboxylase [Planctomycetota bacterium]
MTNSTIAPGPSGLLGNMLTRHGTPVILWSTLLALVCAGLIGFGIEDGMTRWALMHIPLLLWLFVLSFFRNPTRVPPAGDLPISPADGKVIAVEEVEDEVYVDGPAVRIQIFLSVFNVHVNRVPLTGVVEHLRHIDGEYRNAMGASSREVNERQEIGLRTTEGVPVLIRQIAGLIARRIVCPLQVGQEIERGFDFGMIRFGSQTEMVIPARSGVAFQAQVKVGQVVQGGKTVLGDWSE